MQPGEINQVIAFIFHVANAESLLVRIVRYLVVVAACRGNQAQLVIRGLVKRKGSESAQSCALIVQDLGTSSLQAEVGASTGNAAVVGEAVGVVSKAELIFGSIEAAVAGHQLGLAVAFESGTGRR
jgi:hypothetical protein